MKLTRAKAHVGRLADIILILKVLGYCLALRLCLSL